MKPGNRLNRASLLLLTALFLVALLAWCPWITPAYAQQRAADSFESAWRGVADGCGLTCQGCGAIDSQKFLFGSFVTLEYACGLIPADTPEYHHLSPVFVSFLGTVHGFPRP